MAETVDDVDVSKATLSFKTLEAWKAPRLYSFFQITPDLSAIRSLPAKGGASLSVPFQRLGEACKGDLRGGDRKVISSADQEVLLSLDGSWIALRATGKGANPEIENFDIEVSSKSQPGACLLRVNWKSLRSTQRNLLIPSIVFSSAEHRFSGYAVRVKEDFLVASVRYRIEASTRLRSLSLDPDNVFVPVLGARGNFWINRLGYLGADFQIMQSVSSFPKDLSNAEWAFALSSRIYAGLWGATLTFRPHLGIRQQLLLSEEDVSLPDNSRSISMLQGGLAVDIEFADRWLLRGRGEMGFKEFEKASQSLEDWAYWSAEAAVGYRLRPELRLLLETGLHQYTRAADQIRKLDLISCGIEMDF